MVNDVAKDQWDDTKVDEAINDALRDTVLDLLAINKRAVVYTWRANLVSAQTEYEIPTGMLWETSVKLLDSSSGDYLPIDRWSKADVEDVLLGRKTLPSTLTGVYAVEGEAFHIAPAPTANVTNGIEVSGVPTLSLTDDNDVPEIPVAFHMILVHRTALLLKPEGHDDSKESEAAVAQWRANLPIFYRASGAPDSVQVAGLVKDY